MVHMRRGADNAPKDWLRPVREEPWWYIIGVSILVVTAFYGLLSLTSG